MSDRVSPDNVLRFGDYSNGKFSNSAVYEVVRVEHDREGVSLVINEAIREPTAKDYPNRHFHINIPEELLRRIASDHLSARVNRTFYPHDPWPEVTG